jgi:putative protease
MEKQMEQLVGKITHYFPKIGVAVVRLSSSLRQGDEILVRGAHGSFSQAVMSMQIEHNTITQASPGQEVGMKVAQAVREGDQVFLTARK